MSFTRTDQDVVVRPLRISGLSAVTVLLGVVVAWADDSGPASSSVETTNAETRTVEKVRITSLLNRDMASDDWVFVSRQKDSKLADTWKVMAVDGDPVLICRGDPYGYLRTNQQYADFEMELEWKFPADENGNSGILLFTAEEDRVWPKAIQVQLHQPVAGSIFPSGDAKTDNEIRDVRDFARPVNQWNACRISSKGGTVSVEMNGKKVGEVTGCLPSKGWIALQSEGSEVHFRRIRIRELLPSPDAESVDAEAVDGRTGWLLRPRPWFQPVRATYCLVRETAVRPRECRDIECTNVPARGRRAKRLRKSSYVVYRDPLAADAGLPRDGDGVWLDVGGAPPVVVDCRCDRLHRADCRRLGL